MRLLLIEDHDRFAQFVKDGLSKEGFAGAGANICVHTLRGVGYLLSEENTMSPQ